MKFKRDKEGKGIRRFKFRILGLDDSLFLLHCSPEEPVHGDQVLAHHAAVAPHAALCRAYFQKRYSSCTATNIPARLCRG